MNASNSVCYHTGDGRANQSPGLISLQIMYVREHNRIADALHQINPHWDDEILYQESRRINIAKFQQITYYEWLPYFLGESNMAKNGLIYRNRPPTTYVNDYDPTVDASVINAHPLLSFTNPRSSGVGFDFGQIILNEFIFFHVFYFVQFNVGNTCTNRIIAAKRLVLAARCLRSDHQRFR